MSNRIGSLRRKTRHKLSKPLARKGKISLKRYFQVFKTGDKVALRPEPAIHKGSYPGRFIGRNGVIEGKRGRCYKVLIKDINKEKMIIAHPVHLRRI